MTNINKASNVTMKVLGMNFKGKGAEILRGLMIILKNQSRVLNLSLLLRNDAVEKIRCILRGLYKQYDRN